MRLVPTPPGEIAGGRVRFRGRDLLLLSEPDMRRIRGNEIGMIFQEPMSSLNPLLTVGEQIAEVVRLHQGLGRTAARRHAVEMLARVNIPDPELRAGEYPHRLSGGMRQRVMIAMALACRPALLIADEPTTALDVTIQAQILHLIRALQAEMNMSVLFITHNLGVVAQIADRVAVMYAGRIVEQGDVATVFASPLHPYTRALLRSVPARGSGWPRSGAAAVVDTGAGAEPRSPCRRAAATRRAARSRTICVVTRCRRSPRCHPGHDVRCHHWSARVMNSAVVEANGCDRDLPLAGGNAATGHASRCARWTG